ncbi:MAG: SRPBCC domain-containing protein [Pseudomonadota bacterium]|nr:SRPBCC domain-containing protein [Pseudomonadota bacterium]
MSEPLQVRQETFIAAPPAAVFAYLTDPEKIVSWIGSQASTELRPGGLYLLQGVGGRARAARGAFREVAPVHRLAYSFGWDDSAEVPAGSTLIEFDLVEQDGGTLLRMTQSGFPNAAQCAQHDRGWRYYFGRLASVAKGVDPGADIGPAAR